LSFLKFVVCEHFENFGLYLSKQGEVEEGVVAETVLAIDLQQQVDLEGLAYLVAVEPSM
jgi:hypothetical protein